MKAITKFIIIILTICITNSQTLSQESIIRLSPTMGQGWLVLDNFNFDVNYWEVRVLSMSYDSNDEIVFEVVEIIDLVGKNYLKVDTEYLYEPGYTLRITAFLGNGESIQENVLISPLTQEMFGGSPYELCTSWVCHGISYAYKLEHWVNTQTQLTYLSLNYAFSIDNPIYVYFSDVAFNQIDESTTIYWPNVGYISFDDFFGVSTLQVDQFRNDNQAVAPLIIKIKKDLLNPKYNMQNGIIYSDYIYGIAAGLGPWGGAADDICRRTNLSTAEACTPSMGSSIQSLQHAIDHMNTAADPSYCGWPDYHCSTSANVAPPEGLSSLVNNLPLDTTTLKPIIFYWDLIELADSLINGANIGNWWEEYHSISLTDISGNSGEVFNVKVSDVIIDGQPDEIPIYIPQGLYAIGIVDNEGHYLPIIKEMASDEYGGASSLANELSVNIFPVPHVEDSYNMTLASNVDAELIIQYTLFNNYSYIIHESTIIIGPEESETIHISPDAGLPTGVLYHNFIFEDGSYKTICTIKN